MQTITKNLIGEDMEIHNVKDKLPEDNQYVLVYLNKDNWGDSDDKVNNRYWKVVKFVRGISLKDREKMKLSELKDSTEITLTCPTPPGIWVHKKTKRSAIYQRSDEHGNNLRPYCWESFGPSSYFGQEVDYWCELPNLGGIDER